MGEHIYFAPGQLNTSTPQGQALLAHELVHVAQFSNAPADREPVVRCETWRETAAAAYDQTKWAAYHAIIRALKAAKSAGINAARGGLRSLPGWAQGPLGTVIDITDFALDLLIALCLVIIGLAVGFVEGIAGLVEGLAKLCYGLLKFLADIAAAILGRGEGFQEDLTFIANAVSNFWPGLKLRVEAWTERYKKASLEDQAIMGGELIGEVEAFLATFAIGGAKGAQAGSLTVPTGVKLSTELVADASSATVREVVQATVVTTQVTAKPLAQAGVIALQATALGGGPGPAAGGAGAAATAKTFKKPLTKEEVDKAVEPVDPNKHPELQGNKGTKARKATATAAQVTGLDLPGMVEEATQLLRSRGIKGLPPSQYGTQLHAALREVVDTRAGEAPANWDVLAEQPLKDVVKIRPQNAQLTVGQYMDAFGLADRFPELRAKFLNTKLGDLKPDLVVRAPNGQKLVWDLTSQLAQEHLAKTMFYAEVIGREEGGLIRISEEYWRKIAQ